MSFVKGMIHRHSGKDELDFFPTPPWATRAFFNYIFPHDDAGVVWEPACGKGHMAEVIKEYTDMAVIASDIHDYGYGVVGDYLTVENDNVDWIITNPPFNKGVDFALKAIKEAKKGVALLCRTQWIESKKRYFELFHEHRPSIFAPFVERVPMVKGRWDPNATTPMSYAWFVWDNRIITKSTRVEWIPPCRKEMTKLSDYEKFVD